MHSTSFNVSGEPDEANSGMPAPRMVGMTAIIYSEISPYDQNDAASRPPPTNQTCFIAWACSSVIISLGLLVVSVTSGCSTGSDRRDRPNPQTQVPAHGFGSPLIEHQLRHRIQPAHNLYLKWSSVSHHFRLAEPLEHGCHYFSLSFTKVNYRLSL